MNRGRERGWEGKGARQSYLSEDSNNDGVLEFPLIYFPISGRK